MESGTLLVEEEKVLAVGTAVDTSGTERLDDGAR